MRSLDELTEGVLGKAAKRRAAKPARTKARVAGA